MSDHPFQEVVTQVDAALATAHREIAALRAQIEKLALSESAAVARQIAADSEAQNMMQEITDLRGSHARLARAVKKGLGLKNWPEMPGVFTDAVGELVASLRAERDAVSEELEQYRMRLAGALTTAEGHALDVQDDPRTVDYLRTCPTIAACVRVRRERDAARAEVERLREGLGRIQTCLTPPATLIDRALEIARALLAPPVAEPAPVDGTPMPCLCRSVDDWCSSKLHTLRAPVDGTESGACDECTGRGVTFAYGGKDSCFACGGTGRKEKL